MSSHEQDSRRERARKRRQAEEENRVLALREQQQLEHCRAAIEALEAVTRPLRQSLDPHGSPPSPGELHTACEHATSRLFDVLVALRDADLLSHIPDLDQSRLKALYPQLRQQVDSSDDAFQVAMDILLTDPGKRKRLRTLVRDVVEEPGLRAAWDWLYVILNGLTGEQIVAWKGDQGTSAPNAAPSDRTIGVSAPQSNPLRGRQQELLQALVDLKAFDESTVRSLKEAARKITSEALWQSFKKPISFLKRRGLVAAVSGRNGGYYVTEDGRTRIAQLKSRQLPETVDKR